MDVIAISATTMGPVPQLWSWGTIQHLVPQLSVVVNCKRNNEDQLAHVLQFCSLLHHMYDKSDSLTSRGSLSRFHSLVGWEGGRPLGLCPSLTPNDAFSVWDLGVYAIGPPTFGPQFHPWGLAGTLNIRIAVETIQRFL